MRSAEPAVSSPYRHSRLTSATRVADATSIHVRKVAPHFRSSSPPTRTLLSPRSCATHRCSTDHCRHRPCTPVSTERVALQHALGRWDAHSATRPTAAEPDRPGKRAAASSRSRSGAPRPRRERCRRCRRRRRAALERVPRAHASRALSASACAASSSTELRRSRR